MIPTPSAIVTARKEAGLTQTAAAALVHKSLRAWQQWEAGDRAMCPAVWELFQIKSASVPVKPVYMMPVFNAFRLPELIE